MELVGHSSPAMTALYSHACDEQKTIDGLAENPRPHGCQKMHGHENLYRARTGDWRVVYEIRDNVLLVLVVAVGHRREIYRGL
jgi:mRNA interferase RelE/StbE